MAATRPDQDVNPSGTDFLDHASQFYLWCPTYMPLEEQEQTRQSRNKPDIYFRGCVDRWLLNTNDTEFNTWTHRRIVFWSNERYDFAANIQSSVSSDTFFRPLNKQFPLDGAEAQELMEVIFQGTRGIDYTSWNTAAVDTRRVRLVYQKTNVMRPDNAQTIQRRWTNKMFVNKTIKYDDEETGGHDRDPGPSSFAGSPWSVTNSKSPGNLYILDMFMLGVAGASDAELAGTVFPQVGLDSIVYWHER